MRAWLLGTSLLVPLLLGSGEARALRFRTMRRAACCPTLSEGIIQAALNNSLPELNGGSAGLNLKVDAIVIHSVVNPNEGQPLDAGGFTGPIVCTFAGPLPVGTPYSINSVPANDSDKRISTCSDRRFRPKSSFERKSTGLIEKLMCLSTRNNNDCFRIYPAGTPC